MSKSNLFEADVLRMVLHGTSITGICNVFPTDAQSWAVAGHVGDPGDAGSQLTNEATYPGYARSSVPRAPSSWNVTGTSPTAAVLSMPIDWPQCLGAISQTLTHFSIGRQGGGATTILYSGQLSSPILVTFGVVPTLLNGTQIQED